VNEFSSLKKVSVILLVIVLLPALFYSGYEISSLSTSEEMFGSMYRQQLDVVLFSVNQYAWDAVSAWAGTLQNLISDRKSHSSGELVKSIHEFIGQRGTVQTVFVCDTSLKNIVLVESGRPNVRLTRFSEDRIRRELDKGRERLDRLLDFQRVDYRKIEPLAFTDSLAMEIPVVLVFVVKDDVSAPHIVGMVLDARSFIHDILLRKLGEAAGDEFVLAAINKKTGRIVEATSPVLRDEIKQEKTLWLFPDYRLGIRLKGRTIDELVQSRFNRNIAIIAILDVVLLAGAWLIYRTIRREMQLIQLKSDFVSNVSHELRTPLSLIRMFAETLEMKRIKTEAKKHEYYRTIIQESERLTRLVNNLLNFSRMEAGKRNYQLRDLDVNTLVAKVVEFYRLQLRMQHFELVVDLAKNSPTVFGDEEALAEALHNIFDNAIKYSGDGKYIRVATGTTASSAFIEIQDHGIGIASEHHAKIFEKFYRVSSGLVHTTKGSGLGLALVDHIVRAHDGTIGLYSAPGKGSTFRILLPIKIG
jgi:two-component system, OmpR family, phosphate regulon sensor histidine kinase PhoR